MEYSSSNVNELPSALLDNTRSSSFWPDSITKVSSFSSVFKESLVEVVSCDCLGCDIASVGKWLTFYGVSGRAIFLQQVGQPFRFDVGKRLAVVFHVFKGFDDGLGHSLVRALRAADDRKFLRSSDPLMPVVIV